MVVSQYGRSEERKNDESGYSNEKGDDKKGEENGGETGKSENVVVSAESSDCFEKQATEKN